MARKTHINIEGQSFVAELVDGHVVSRNGFDTGLLFRIKDKQGEIIGCISAFISLTTRAVWGSQANLTPEIVENLFLRIIPHIPFAASVSDFSSIYPDCIQLFIEPSDTRYY